MRIFLLTSRHVLTYRSISFSNLLAKMNICIFRSNFCSSIFWIISVSMSIFDGFGGRSMIDFLFTVIQEGLCTSSWNIKELWNNISLKSSYQFIYDLTQGIFEKYYLDSCVFSSILGLIMPESSHLVGAYLNKTF